MTIMKNSFDYSTYLSPFTTRYGSSEMRTIWSEENRRKLWRKVWTELARAEYQAGFLTKDEFLDIEKQSGNLDIVRSKEIEKDVYHELMSEIKAFAEIAPIGGGKIHLGATSADILDNAQMIQIHEALNLTKKNLRNLLKTFVEKIKEYQNVVCMGYTHLQPAEPTTLGYRFAFYAQDLLIDLQFLEKIEPFLQGKGMKGAVGTAASYTQLLGSEEKVQQLEESILQELGIQAVDIATQTYPRKIDLLIVEALSNIAASLHKFCFDFRIMQSPAFGEWVEKRNSKRIGSSAMPFKRNPDKAEKVCSLCRYVSSLVPLAWSNPANALLERTLDDSAAQRIFLPEGFLTIDECLHTVQGLLDNLLINQAAIEKNLATYGQFSGVEPILMAITKKGANRQQMHELLKHMSMKVWEAKDQGEETSLLALLQNEPEITKYLSPSQLQQLCNPSTHIGTAKKSTALFLKKLNNVLQS